MSLWIATWFCSRGVHDCVIVESDDEAAAAEIAAEAMQAEEEDKGSQETVTHVFIAPFDSRVAYSTRIAVERSAMQCCGGPAPSWVDCGGHYATCPERPPGTGQPRPGEEREHDAA